MIEAIVLAAGESRRMGMLKPLLRFGETTFLEQIVGVLRQCNVGGITVVLGSQAEAIRASTDLSGVNVVINRDYRDGQLSSLIAGLRNRGEGVPPLLFSRRQDAAGTQGQDALATEASTAEDLFGISNFSPLCLFRISSFRFQISKAGLPLCPCFPRPIS